MNRTLLAALAAALAAAACGKTPKTEQPAMSDMPGMPRTQTMAMKSMDMIAAVRAHLDSVDAMSPEAAAAAWSAHDAMMSQMLDAMGADMMNMGMQADSAWTALADSVRRDLAELPGLSGPTYGARLKTHTERARRLLDTHQAMMSEMMTR
jgi:hypothetical protein